VLGLLVSWHSLGRVGEGPEGTQWKEQAEEEEDEVLQGRGKASLITQRKSNDPVMGGHCGEASVDVNHRVVVRGHRQTPQV
jgi:hypothetical protein